MTNETFRARRVRLTRIVLPLIIIGIVTAAILLLPMKERAEMIPSRAPSDTDGGIPSIDLNAPAETKTATFAMG